GAQDKSVRLAAKDNGGVEGVGSAGASPSRGALPSRISSCRGGLWVGASLGQAVHFVAQLREFFLKALDAGAQVGSSGGFFLQVAKRGADQAQGQPTGLQTARAPFSFSLSQDALSRAG